MFITAGVGATETACLWLQLVCTIMEDVSVAWGTKAARATVGVACWMRSNGTLKWVDRADCVNSGITWVTSCEVLKLLGNNFQLHVFLAAPDVGGT